MIKNFVDRSSAPQALFVTEPANGAQYPQHFSGEIVTPAETIGKVCLQKGFAGIIEQQADVSGNVCLRAFGLRKTELLYTVSDDIVYKSHSSVK